MHDGMLSACIMYARAVAGAITPALSVSAGAISAHVWTHGCTRGGEVNHAPNHAGEMGSPGGRYPGGAEPRELGVCIWGGDAVSGGLLSSPAGREASAIGDDM